jgi:hypothetical protein
MQSLLAGDVGRMHRDAPRVCNLSAWHKVRNEKVTLARPHPGTACRHHSFAGALFMSVCDQGRSPRSL